MELDERKIAVIFKAFCDENRIRILKLLETGEKCACKLLEELDITQPTLSHHMKILCDSGVVMRRKEALLHIAGGRGVCRPGPERADAGTMHRAGRVVL